MKQFGKQKDEKKKQKNRKLIAIFIQGFTLLSFSNSMNFSITFTSYLSFGSHFRKFSKLFLFVIFFNLVHK